jgi:hypothetical protein
MPGKAAGKAARKAAGKAAGKQSKTAQGFPSAKACRLQGLVCKAGLQGRGAGGGGLSLTHTPGRVAAVSRHRGEGGREGGRETLCQAVFYIRG